MTSILIGWFGDIVGRPGRDAIAHAAPRLRDAGADILIANAENARHGRGLHPTGFDEIRAAGIDAITLGDHTTDDPRLLALLEDPHHPVAKPINLPMWPSAKTRVRLEHGGTALHVLTVIGCLFMRIEPADPFDALDREIESITRTDPRALVLVEIHAEATSEKIALVWHCRRRWPENVLVAVGSHTHVQTADPRIVEDHLAAITDVGMCGGRRGVIGFRIQPSLERFRGIRSTPLDVAEADVAAEGCLIRLDTGARRATQISPFRIEAP